LIGRLLGEASAVEELNAQISEAAKAHGDEPALLKF
jgi:hypothetical protein